MTARDASQTLQHEAELNRRYCYLLNKQMILHKAHFLIQVFHEELRMCFRIPTMKSTAKDYVDRVVDGKCCNLASNDAGVALIR